MRRPIALLSFLLLFSTAAFAVEPVLRNPDRGDRATRHVIVHANATLTDADRTELAKKGLVIQRAARNGRYLARVAEGASIDDARIAAIETISAEKKISRTAMREARSGKTWADVNVYFHRDVTIEEARAALLAAGAGLEDPFVLDFAPAQRINARIAPSQLKALASDDRVSGISGPIRFDVVSDNSRSAALSHVPELFSAPYNLSGAGVTVSLFELARAQGDHVEFGGRMTVQESVSGGTSGDASHATHVAGTIGASGINPDAKGMAPGVRLYEFCIRSGGNSCRNDFMKDKNEQLPKLGSLADNNSWGYRLGWEQEDFWVWNGGDDYFGAYELEIVSPIDDIALERGILFVHSAGNEGATPSLNDWGQHRHVDDNLRTIQGKVWCYSQNGSGTDCPATAGFCNGDPDPCEKVKHHTQSPYETLGFTAAGKNTIAVGAVLTVGGVTDIASFSSRGPAQDGRVKPDVVARGFGVLSTVPTNSYGNNQGTSMATPVVTGIAALLIEQWRKTFAGANPDPVQLKALIIAGADDLGRPGPDFTYGFGLVNAKNSADLIINDGGTGGRIRNLTVTHGGTQEFPIIVSSPQDVRVVLQWGDPGVPFLGEFIAAEALVNDLDVKIVGPTGTEYLPYTLDKSQVEKNAAPGVNKVDNTEQIEIKNAAAGTYRVVVTGRDVPEGPQKAVVVSTARTAAPCVDPTELRNNDANSPYGNLTPGQTVHAALCTSDDRDLFAFVAAGGNVAVTFRTSDTALNVLAGTASFTIPANTTQTITLPAASATGLTTYTLAVTPSGTIGAEPLYSFTPQFTQQTAPRRRSTRH